MWWKKISAPETPIWLAAAILFVGSLLLIAQILLGEIVHGKQMKLSAALIGVQNLPENIPLSVKTLIDGSYQAALARRIGSRQPYYPTAVRLRNQLEFSVFGVSPTLGVVKGSGGQLLETGYVTDYCSRNMAAFLPAAPAWAEKIRQMQDATKAQGKNFLYIITPSKVAQYPDELPAGFPCLSSRADRMGLVPAWAALMRQDGVHLVNTTAIISAAHKAYPFRLFPRGGTHWNQVGSALAAQAIEAALETQRQDGLFKPLSFTWKMSPHPDSVDSDLVTLLNLFWAPAGPEVPVVSLQQSPPAPGCRKLRIVIIGGSFMQSIGSTLARLPCEPNVVEYFYWEVHRDAWDKNGVVSTSPVNPALRDRELRNADIVLYEENESLLGHSNHGAAYYEWLRDQNAKMQ